MQASVLPILRQDIRLHRINAEQGQARFLIHDPLSHRYFTLSKRSIEILRYWPRKPTSPDALRDIMRKNNAPLPDDAELEGLIQFLRTANLLIAREKTLDAVKKQSLNRKSMVQKITGLLFLKLPLLKPAGFIEWAYPVVRPLFTKTFALLCVLLAMVAALMAVRQPQIISEYFIELLTFNGGIAFIFTMAMVKIVHEFGHAFQAYRHGSRIPRMGIMLMFGIPLPYTELSDVWQLKRRKSRLFVDLGGILAELALASWASIVFFIAAEGPIKTAAFVIALASVIMSLAINLNPLMRFDGYYILSDYFRVPNLQTRSNNLARWFLRKTLFGDRTPSPENWSPAITRTLVIFGFSVWIYRFFLYLGFAILAYSLAFKALGILLFALELYVFIAKPVVQELKHWHKNREAYMKNPRTYFSFAIFSIMIGLLFWPFQGVVKAPARAQIDQGQHIITPFSGVIEALHQQPTAVQKGDVIIALADPDHAYFEQKLTSEIKLLNERITRAASDKDDLAAQTITTEILATKMKELAQLRDKAQRMVIRAEHDGILRDFDLTDRQLGTMIAPKTQIGILEKTGNLDITGYVSAKKANAITPPQSANFVPSDPTLPAIEITIDSISPLAAMVLDYPELGTSFGGPIETRIDDNRKLKGSWYTVTARSDQPAVTAGVVTGQIVTPGTTESYAQRIWVAVLATLRKETGLSLF